MKFGTTRTRSLLDKLGSPDDRLKIIHVAGTNGKGSVCEYISSILRCAGKRTGTYTTPEVLSFEDQFRIDGISSLALAEEYISAAVACAEGEDDRPTAYEIQTAAAFLMFASEGCEYAVIECCMGGLEDTTNAVRSKAVSVITSVSLEHTAYLGGSIRDICRHKAGIIKDCPAIVSACVKGEARDYFSSRGAIFSGDDLEIISSGLSGTIFKCGAREYFTKLPGCVQPYNAAAAIETAHILGIDEQAICDGIREAYLPCRLQVERAAGRDYILDGSHNPESVMPLASLLRKEYAGKECTLIYACLADKDAREVIGRLSGCAERIYAVLPPGPRAMDHKKIYSACSSVFHQTTCADSLRGALESAVGDVVVVFGTFTILEEALEWIKQRRLKP